ncbi:MAG TPA: HD domain-containing phosphohydrolase [Actinomycetes bacterium]|nr:HD domain-containing phosphohydrolase [Actinomycetes bacterium]
MGGEAGGALRSVELLAALSLATDLGTGQPLEHALRTGVLAVRLGGLAGVPERELADAFHAALLHSVGCTADAHEAARLYGDDIAVRAAYATVDGGRPAEVVGFLLRQAGAGAPPLRRAALLAGALAEGPRRPRRALAAHCEVARRLAPRLGLGGGVGHALGFVFERWDGKGFPAGAAGAAIPLAARLLHVARDADVFRAQAGAEAAAGVVAGRAGTAFDPELAARFARHAGELFAELDGGSAWQAALAVEPGRPGLLAGDALDEACAAVADFADLKSPFTLGHSAGVAELAEAAAWRLRLPPAEVAAVRRAGLLHDLGRVGVSNRVWDKPGPLSDGEWEQVRLHPYYTERALARSPALAPVGALAAGHHERLDGSGYHRGVPAAQLGMPARVLAAADVRQALSEARPHRPALPPAAAAEALAAEARAGRLDAEAVDAVLGATGRRGGRRPWPAGLSEREVQVLRLLARGLSNKAIAARLGVAAKTVGHHVQHLYAKAGVSTRAGATLFAVEHDLLRDGDG